MSSARSDTSEVAFLRAASLAAAGTPGQSLCSEQGAQWFPGYFWHAHVVCLWLGRAWPSQAGIADAGAGAAVAFHITLVWVRQPQADMEPVLAESVG